MQIKIALAALLPTLVFGSPRLRANEPNEALAARDPGMPQDLFARGPGPVTCAAPSPSAPKPDPNDCLAVANQAAASSYMTACAGVTLTYNTCIMQIVSPGAATAGSTLKTALDAISQCQSSAGVYALPAHGSNTVGAITIGYSGQASTGGLVTGSVCGGS